MKKLILITVIYLFSVYDAVNANAVTIGFEIGTGTPLSYTEGLITVKSVHPSPKRHIHFGNVGDSDRELFNHAGCCSTAYEFTSSSGKFNLDSLKIERIFIGSSIFSSDLGDKAVVSSSGILNLNWAGITKLTWDVTKGTTYLDDLTYTVHDNHVNNSNNVIPEPATVLLICSGIAILALYQLKMN